MLHKRSALMILACVVSAGAITAMGCACDVEDGQVSVKIKDVTYSGDGCPSGSAHVEFNNTRTAFTLTFDEYNADLQSVATWDTAQKNCQIQATLDLPEHQRATIATVDFNGHVELGEGVDATQRTEYSQYGTGAVVRESRLEGPLNQDYHRRDTFGRRLPLWSSCTGSRSIVMDTELNVAQVTDNPEDLGHISLDSIEFSLLEDGRALSEACR